MVVRSEFAPRQHRPDSDLPGHVDSVMRQWPADKNLGGHVGSVIQQATESVLQAHQLRRQLGKPFGFPLGVAVLDSNVAPLDVPEIAQSPLDGVDLAIACGLL